MEAGLGRLHSVVYEWESHTGFWPCRHFKAPSHPICDMSQIRPQGKGHARLLLLLCLWGSWTRMLSGSFQDTLPYKTDSISSFLPPSRKPGDAIGPQSSKCCPIGATEPSGEGLGSAVRLPGPKHCSHHGQAVRTWAQDLTFLRLTFSFEN